MRARWARASDEEDWFLQQLGGEDTECGWTIGTEVLRTLYVMLMLVCSELRSRRFAHAGGRGLVEPSDRA